MDQPDRSLINYECRDGVATITLNRSDKLNAFNDEMVKELAAVFHRFDLDEEKRNSPAIVWCRARRSMP